jgi:hypothetical protein
MAVFLRHSVAGVDPVLGGLKLIQFLGVSVRKRMQNAELSMQLNSYLE